MADRGTATLLTDPGGFFLTPYSEPVVEPPPPPPAGASGSPYDLYLTPMRAGRDSDLYLHPTGPTVRYEAVAYVRLAADVVAAMADVASRNMLLPRTAGEGTGISDTVRRVITANRTTNEQAQSLESAARGLVTRRSVNESTSVTELASRTVSATRAVLEQVQASDSAQRAFSAVRTAAGSFNVLETAYIGTQLVRTAAEHVQVLVDGIRQVDTLRLAAVTSAWSAAGERTVEYARLAAEIVAEIGDLSNSILFGRLFERVAEEALIEDATAISQLILNREGAVEAALQTVAAERVTEVIRRAREVLPAMTDVGTLRAVFGRRYGYLQGRLTRRYRAFE